MLDTMFWQAYPLALRSACVHSAAAVASGAVLLTEREDVEQEILIRVWRALFKFDPARAGLRTFIEVVVSTQFMSMLRSHRRRPEFESLNERHAAGDWQFREVELRVDVGRALAGASVFDRAVALSLAECSAVETCRRLGVSRPAIYRAIGRLRLAFTAAGLTRRRSPCIDCSRKSNYRSHTSRQRARP